MIYDDTRHVQRITEEYEQVQAVCAAIGKWVLFAFAIHRMLTTF